MTLSRSRLWQRLFRTRAEDSLPHHVTHQRVYIVPTKRGWVFLLTLLLMLVASINYALSLGYALSFVLTGLFAASLMHTYRNLAGVQVDTITAADCFAGESMSFTVALGNERTRPRHGLRLITPDGISAMLRLEAEQSGTVTLAVPTTARGIRRLGRLTLQSDWPLGLWTCWSYLHVPSSGLVFPRAETAPPPLPSLHTEGTTNPVNSNSAQGDVSGLRRYVPGDSIGSIAWKNAARGQGLLARTFDSGTSQAPAILTLQQTGRTQLEEQLSRLCAWILHAERSQTDYALQLPGAQLEKGHGRDQLTRALRVLALHGTTP